MYKRHLKINHQGEYLKKSENAHEVDKTKFSEKNKSNHCYISFSWIKKFRFL